VREEVEEGREGYGTVVEEARELPNTGDAELEYGIVAAEEAREPSNTGDAELEYGIVVAEEEREPPKTGEFEYSVVEKPAGMGEVEGDGVCSGADFDGDAGGVLWR
jgi:hypothetical protein